MTPNEIACRKCAAQPNEQCFDGWKFDLDTQKEVKNYRNCAHLERIFDAGTFTLGAVPVPKEVIDRAAEEWL